MAQAKEYMVASMRPRHKAAENRSGCAAFVGWHHSASMRPRHKAAENTARRAPSRPMLGCFNEAAA